MNSMLCFSNSFVKIQTYQKTCFLAGFYVLLISSLKLKNGFSVVLNCVCHEKSKDFCNCINDGSRPTAGVIQVKPANHSKVLYSKDMVLSVREKATEVVRCVLWR